MRISRLLTAWLSTMTNTNAIAAAPFHAQDAPIRANTAKQVAKQILMMNSAARLRSSFARKYHHTP